jgi:HEAT repeat protein
MKKSFFVVAALVLGMASEARAGLPKQTVQALVKALQDSSLEVRTSAALALAEVPDAAEQASKTLETVLIASSEAVEQEALVKALIVANDSTSVKRLSESLVNPQFTWGTGAKAKAVTVIGKIGNKKSIKWLTDMVAGEQEPAVRAAAARALGEIGAPPKKEKKD